MEATIFVILLAHLLVAGGRRGAHNRRFWCKGLVVLSRHVSDFWTYWGPKNHSQIFASIVLPVPFVHKRPLFGPRWVHQQSKPAAEEESTGTVLSENPREISYLLEREGVVRTDMTSTVVSLAVIVIVVEEFLRTTCLCNMDMNISSPLDVEKNRLAEMGKPLE